MSEPNWREIANNLAASLRAVGRYVEGGLWSDERAALDAYDAAVSKASAGGENDG